MIRKTKFLNIFFLFLFFTIFITGSSSSRVNKSILTIEKKEDVKKTIKILMVNSYCTCNVCTFPQYNGFKSELKKIIEENKLLLSSFTFTIESIDLKTKKVNCTPYQKSKISEEVLNYIKVFKPDFLFTTDDDAFEYVAIPCSKENSLTNIIFSGINKSFSYYEEKYDLDRKLFSGVEENIDMKKVYELFSEVGLNFDYIYIISDKQNNSERDKTEKIVEKNIVEYLTKNKKKYEVVEVSTSEDLRVVLKELNTKKDNLLLILVQKIVDLESGKIIDYSKIAKIVNKYNKNMIDIGLNHELTKNFGISISCSPDFFNMGRRSAEFLIDNFKKESSELGKIIKSKNYLTVNVNKLDKINYSTIYKNGFHLIDQIYSGVE